MWQEQIFLWFPAGKHHNQDQLYDAVWQRQIDAVMHNKSETVRPALWWETSNILLPPQYNTFFQQTPEIFLSLFFIVSPENVFSSQLSVYITSLLADKYRTLSLYRPVWWFYWNWVAKCFTPTLRRVDRTEQQWNCDDMLQKKKQQQHFSLPVWIVCSCIEVTINKSADH